MYRLPGTPQSGLPGTHPVPPGVAPCPCHPHCLWSLFRLGERPRGWGEPGFPNAGGSMRPGSHRRRPRPSSGPCQSWSVRIDLPQCAWPAPVKGIWGFLIWLQGVAGNLGAWVSPRDRPGHVSLGSKLPVSGATSSFPALSPAFDVTVSNFGPSDGCTVKLHYGFNWHPWPRCWTPSHRRFAHIYPL